MRNGKWKIYFLERCAGCFHGQAGMPVLRGSVEYNSKTGGRLSRAAGCLFVNHEQFKGLQEVLLLAGRAKAQPSGLVEPVQSGSQFVAH